MGYGIVRTGTVDDITRTGKGRQFVAGRNILHFPLLADFIHQRFAGRLGNAFQVTISQPVIRVSGIIIHHETILPANDDEQAYEETYRHELDKQQGFLPRPPGVGVRTEYQRNGNLGEQLGR